MLIINALIKNRKKNPELYFFWIALTAAFIALYVYSPQISAAVADSLKICATSVIPALFPFFIANNLAVESGLAEFIGKPLAMPFRRLFGIGSAGASSFVLGAVGGFPAGAECAVRLYRNGKCSRDETERMIAFCNNTGPAFPVVFIGSSLLGSPAAGAVLYTLQLVSAAAVGIGMRFTAKDSPKGEKNPGIVKKTEAGATDKTPSEIFILAITDASLTMLRTCGFLVAFAVISSFAEVFLESTGLMNGIFSSALFGFLELTESVLRASAIDGRYGYALCGLALGWAGMSVHMQTSVVCHNVNPGQGKLSMKRYYIGKLFQGILCALAAYALYPFVAP